MALHPCLWCHIATDSPHQVCSDECYDNLSEAQALYEYEIDNPVWDDAPVENGSSWEGEGYYADIHEEPW
jgi:hypothetical protein